MMVKFLIIFGLLCMAPTIVFGVMGVSNKIILPNYDSQNSKFKACNEYLENNGWGKTFLADESSDLGPSKFDLKTIVVYIQNVINSHWTNRRAHRYNTYMSPLHNCATELSRMYIHGSPEEKDEIKLIYQDLVTGLTIIYMDYKK